MGVSRVCIICLVISLTVRSTIASTPEESSRFSDIIANIAEERSQLSQHRFFKMLADNSVPYQKRMAFTPYWTFFAMSFADLLDSWLYVANPQSELEKRINIFVGEDNFHYNFFLHDIENVLGYTLDRFGSFSAVIRHLWGDDSKAIRRLVYTWAVCAEMYGDPLLTLVTFEAVEAGLKDIFEVTFNNIYLPENGSKDFKYFGLTHVELEANHTQTAWFKGDSPVRPLGELEVTKLQMENAQKVVTKLFNGFHSLYDEMYNLAVAEDSIKPEKYKIEGYPPIHGFPSTHPNQALHASTPRSLDENCV